MRDVRISREVLRVIGRSKAADLRAGPEPGLFECAVCRQPGDADIEPTSVLAFRYPRKDSAGGLINIIWAHAGCSEPTLTDEDRAIDVAEYMRLLHLIPLLISGDDRGIAGLLLEPKVPGIERAEQRSNAHVQLFLREGLQLLARPDFDQLVLVPGWRAVLMPGGHGQTLVTILSGGDNARVIAADLGIQVDESWLERASSGTIALYAGLTGMLRTPRRDLMTLVRALVGAARNGALTGGLIQAVRLDLA